MVKAIPRQQDRLTRRRRKYIKQQHKEADSLLLGLETDTGTPTRSLSPSSNHLHLHPNFKPDQITATPPSVPKKRTCSCSSSSPSYSPSTYGTCSSSSPPLSPSTLSSPSFLLSDSPPFSLLHCNCVSSPATTARTQTQQPQFLRRTLSDPPVFRSDSCADSKKLTGILQELAASPSPPVSRNLMGQLLPPLPPSPSPRLLRRTVSDPVTLSSDEKTSISKEKNEKAKMQEQMVKAEKLLGNWTLIKVNCGCGSGFKFLYCGTDGKCYKLV